MSFGNTAKDGSGTAYWLLVDSDGRLMLAGAAAEDAAVAGNPLLVGGRYDATDRTLDDGDAGAVALDAAGRVKSLDEGGQEVTALASAARTATTNSSDLTNPGARGVILTLDVTAIVDTPSITLNISYRSPLGGNYEKLFSAAAAVTATGVHTYVLYPGDVVAADDVVEVGKLPLPRTWRVEMTHADADSITYSVSGSYLL